MGEEKASLRAMEESREASGFSAGEASMVSVAWLLECATAALGEAERAPEALQLFDAAALLLRLDAARGGSPVGAAVLERVERAVAEIRADLAPVEASRPEWVRLEDGGYEASWLGLLLCVWREDDDGPWMWGVVHRPMDEPWSPDSEPTRELAQRRAEAVAEALTRAL